jgi:hypothetical protein
MIAMKSFVILLCLLIALGFVLPFIATAATDTYGGDITATPTRSEIRSFETPTKVATARVQQTTVRSAEVVNPITRPTPVLSREVANPVTQPTPVLSGEVEYPVTPHGTPTPTFTHRTETPTPTTPRITVSATQTIPVTTVSATQTIPVTTVPVTQTTPVPVVTVTVFVYPSGDVYSPLYYYPPYYPYSINSYYPSGSLTITSNPSDAVVIIDGYNYGTTPYMFTGLMTGYHTVEVDYPGYEAYVTNVYVDSGTNQEIYAALTPLVSYGSLYIDSTPGGADVYVDGNYQGTSPVTVSAMAVGAHQVELHLAGYEVLTSTQNVYASQGTVANLVLTPYSSSSAYGSIDITSNLPGALVYLDGIYKGSTQSGNTFNIIAVSPGTHTLFLHLPGYSDITQTVEVSAGQITNVNAVFTPQVTQKRSAAATPATGSIIVTSTPAGGQVSVDNQFRGVAPVTIYNVAPGTHIVNVHLNGFSDWSTSVDVTANQVVQVSATMTPGTGTATTPAHGVGLSMAATVCALAVGVLLIATRIRK